MNVVFSVKLNERSKKLKDSILIEWLAIFGFLTKKNLAIPGVNLK
jgi:hypothetical protein